MKRSSRITSIRSNAIFHEKLLEKFVNSNPPGMRVKVNRDMKRANFSTSYKHIDFCFAKIPLNGTVEIDYLAGFFLMPKSIEVPVNSMFMVTCIKDTSGHYKSTWSSSLS